MPKVKKDGSAKQRELPATLQRSSKKAQRTFAKAHDNALREYGEESIAHRVAYAALKRKYRKSGNRWRSKSKS